MTDDCDLCGVALPNANAGPLCPTCLRFARLAREHDRTDPWEAFIALERAMLDGEPGFLALDRWLPEEIAMLDKFYTLGDMRRRLKWLDLSRSFRGLRGARRTSA